MANKTLARIGEFYERRRWGTQLALTSTLVSFLAFGLITLTNKCRGMEEFRQQRSLEHQLRNLCYEHRKKFEEKTFLPNGPYDINKDGKIDLEEKVRAYEGILKNP